MKYFCKFCNRPMKNVKSFIEFKSNQFCNECFNERVEAMKIDGLKDDNWKMYNIDISGMNETDINKVLKDLFDIDFDDENEDDEN